MKSARRSKKVSVQAKRKGLTPPDQTYIWGAVLLFVLLVVLGVVFSQAVGPTGAVPKVFAQVVYPLIPTNLLSNNSFDDRTNVGDTPSYWTRESLATSDTLDCSDFHSDHCSFQLTNYGGVQKVLHQMIPVSSHAGSKITIAAWSKAKNVSVNATTGGIYWVQAVIYNTDGTVSYGTEEEIPGKGNILEFSPGTHDYQPMTKTFVAPKAFRAIDYRIRFTGVGTVWFDDVGLSIQDN